MLKRAFTPLRMTMLTTLVALTGAGWGTDARACTVQTQIRAATPDGSAWQALDGALARCGVQTDALRPHIVALDNVTEDEMSRARALRQMNDLVRAYEGQISTERLIKDDWRIVGVVAAVEAWNLVYRRDILAAANVPPPTSYGEILRVAAQLRAVGAASTPVAAALEPGDDMAQTFIDVYVGMGGTLFLEGFDASIYNPRGVATLEMFQMMSGFAPADFMETDVADVEAKLLGGDIALAMLPSDRAAEVAGRMGNRVAVAAAPISGWRPAATVEWIGLGISADATDEEAASAFAAIVGAISPEMASANPQAANWLIDGYAPAMPAAAVVDTVRQGALPYPAGPEMRLLREAIGTGIEPFLRGRMDPSEALLEIELTYKRAAQERGLIN